MNGQPLTVNADDSVLVIAAHPDDETLAAGGLLQQARAAGARTAVAIATDGENNPWPQRVLERRWRIGPDEMRRFGARRRAEAARALARLGLDESDVIFLSLPDQGLTRLVMQDPTPAVSRLRAELDSHQPTLLVAPSIRDRHPDHSALALLVEAACARSAPRRRLHYQVHGRREPRAVSHDLEVRLTPAQRDAKRRAILAYPSQLVFRGRFFLSFAADHEVFEPFPTAAREDARHPIPQAHLDGDHIRLWLRSRSPIWSLQRKTVLVFGMDGAGRSTAAACEAADGELVVPRARFASAKRLFVKLEHRWSFFDADGWREIAIADAAHETTEEAESLPCRLPPSRVQVVREP
jgi:LmbE family N-acetylglucosaminyl deacetylase